MSFFKPIIIENMQESLANTSNQINNDFIITPYDFFKQNLINLVNPLVTLMIFDLPTEIIISFDGITIPGKCFDYFNPLLINSLILDKISFINRNTLQCIDSFKCKILNSKIIDSLIKTILNTSIYYPPQFIIDYKNLTVSRSFKGKQICDFFSKSDMSISPDISILQNQYRNRNTPDIQFIDSPEQFMNTLREIFINFEPIEVNSSEEDESDSYVDL